MLDKVWHTAAAAGRLFWEERRCAACGRAIRPGKNVPDLLFCPECALSLERRAAGYCPLCGELAAWPLLTPTLCAACLARGRVWTDFMFHAPHEGLMRILLLRSKFQGDVALGHALGRLLAAHPDLSEKAWDAVVPVPLHRGRLARRGYNQALELARPVAAAWCAGSAVRTGYLRPDWLRRVCSGQPQSRLPMRERASNVQGAFCAAPAVSGKKILLVDDILTTGATLEAACRALLSAGAWRVGVAVMARTPRRCLL